MEDEAQKQFWDVIVDGGSIAAHPDTLKEFFASLSAEATIGLMGVIGYDILFGGKSKRVIPNDYCEPGSLYAIPKLPEFSIAPTFTLPPFHFSRSMVVRRHWFTLGSVGV